MAVASGHHPSAHKECTEHGVASDLGPVDTVPVRWMRCGDGVISARFALRPSPLVVAACGSPSKQAFCVCFRVHTLNGSVAFRSNAIAFEAMRPNAMPGLVASRHQHGPDVARNGSIYAEWRCRDGPLIVCSLLLIIQNSGTQIYNRCRPITINN